MYYFILPKYYLLGVMLICSTITVQSQVHVDSLKDVGIGTNDPEGAKMKIQTTDESKALHIFNTSPDSMGKYGIYNYVDSSGLGIKYGIYSHTEQSQSSTTDSYGLYSRLTPRGTGLATGLRNDMGALATGEKYGIHNTITQNTSASADLRGIYNNYKTGGSGKMYGIFNQGRLFDPVLGKVTGIYNYLNHTSSVLSDLIVGFDNIIIPGDSSSSWNIYGIRSTIARNGDFTKYGINSSVTRDSGSVKNIYGIFSGVISEGGAGSLYGVRSVANTADTGIGYGVYGEVTGTNASNSYGGYFVGDVYCSTGMYLSSDRKIKENIADFQLALSLIERLRPVTYNYRIDQLEEASERKQYGFIAQEVEEILPEIVKEVAIPGKTIYETQVDEVGDEENGIQSVTTTYAVGEEPPTTRMAMNYTALIPILVKAIQEQQEQIKQQLLQNDSLRLEIQQQKTEIQTQNKLISDLTKRMNDIEEINLKKD